MTVLVTGAAGFIGMHTCLHLLKQSEQVIGIDYLSGDDQILNIKRDRLNCLLPYENFSFHVIDISNYHDVMHLFAETKLDCVIHLAAQAGVRQSISNPYPYIESNINGFLNILEACRVNTIGHLIYASSSSVYGSNSCLPLSEHQNTDHPLSMYAATKKTNELMAHTYSHLYGLPTTGLRFFTVYGPWGRPDMAPFLFTKAMLEGLTITVYHQGELIRDFTYIDDIVHGIASLIEKPATANPSFDTNKPDPATSNTPYRIFNIGNNNPVLLNDFINELEKALMIQSIKIHKPLQPGDVLATHADVSELELWNGFCSTTSLSIGIQQFVAWYLDYFGYTKK